ncbi:MAG: Nif11-like leader peptide family RiPP precursor [Planctomycetes bacterium]|nr:Nif11-like leader peptide family RiPP precursor [Planctomycetota bacterium]
MTMEDAKAVAERLRSDEALVTELGQVKTEEDFKRVMNRLGYDTDSSEVKIALEETHDDEEKLSDAQLGQVAGGGLVPPGFIKQEPSLIEKLFKKLP